MQQVKVKPISKELQGFLLQKPSPSKQLNTNFLKWAKDHKNSKIFPGRFPKVGNSNLKANLQWMFSTGYIPSLQITLLNHLSLLMGVRGLNQE